MSPPPIRVVFLCVENACRSQMAEAFARYYSGGRLEAYSAGSRPRGQVDPLAVTVMREKGIELNRHASKSLTELPANHWDVVVSMGCGEACAALPAKQHIEWKIPDPAREPLEHYRAVCDLIEGAVKTLIERLSESTTG